MVKSIWFIDQIPTLLCSFSRHTLRLLSEQTGPKINLIWPFCENRDQKYSMGIILDFLSQIKIANSKKLKILLEKSWTFVGGDLVIYIHSQRQKMRETKTKKMYYTWHPNAYAYAEHDEWEECNWCYPYHVWIDQT